MTLRRLYILLRGLPYDGDFKTELRAAAEAALVPAVDQIKARQAYYASRGN